MRNMVEIDDKIEEFKKLRNRLNSQIMRLNIRRSRINYRINWAKKMRQRLAQEEEKNDNKIY